MKRRLHYHPSGTKTEKKIRVATEKANKKLPNFPTDNISEISVLFYAGAKLVFHKNQCSPKEHEEKYQTWMGLNDS